MVSINQTLAEHLRGMWLEHKAEEMCGEDMDRVDWDKAEEEFYADRLIDMGYDNERVDEMLAYLAHN